MSNSVELASLGADDLAGELDDRALEARGTGRGTGTRCSRAKWAARTLPSMPRWPKPPGTRMPATPSRRSWRLSWVSASESTQRTLASTPCAQAAWRSASVTRQVGVGQLDVLADEGDLEDRLGRLDPLDERAPASRGPARAPGRRGPARGRSAGRGRTPRTCSGTS